jgi:hypothetical protein
MDGCAKSLSVVKQPNTRVLHKQDPRGYLNHRQLIHCLLFVIPATLLWAATNCAKKT